MKKILIVVGLGLGVWGVGLLGQVIAGKSAIKGVATLGSFNGLTYTATLTNHTTFTQNSNPPPACQQGDTTYFSDWTKNTDGGAWSGGLILGTVGDGCWAGTNSAHIVGPLNLTAYNPASIGGTTVNSLAGFTVNPMSGWGTIGQNFCMDSTESNNSCSVGFHLFSFKGTLYWAIMSQFDGDPEGGSSQAIIASPDYLHACNEANISGFSGCTSSNWSSTGDVITDQFMTYNGGSHQAVQWFKPNTGDPTRWQNNMTRLNVIQWSQDSSTGYTLPTGIPPTVDTGFVYAISMYKDNVGTQADYTTENPSAMYLSRFPMIATNAADNTAWQHWNGTTYVADSSWTLGPNSSATLNLGSADLRTAFAHTEIYSTDCNCWVMAISAFSSNINGIAIFMSRDLKNWVRTTLVGSPAANTFPSWMMPTYTSLGGGSFKISQAATTGNILGFNEWTFAP
jgi:hypothetical protein